MKKLECEIEINATAPEIWNTITELERYTVWAAKFHEGSYFEGGWNAGDKINFLIVNKAGFKEGMVAEIAVADFPKRISIRLIGFMVEGAVDTESPEVKAWAPAYENYFIEELAPNLCLLKVEAETTEEFYDMMAKLWPPALQALKAEAEQG